MGPHCHTEGSVDRATTSAMGCLLFCSQLQLPTMHFVSHGTDVTIWGIQRRESTEIARVTKLKGSRTKKGEQYTITQPLSQHINVDFGERDWMQIEEPLLYSDILRHAPFTPFTAGSRKAGGWQGRGICRIFSLCEDVFLLSSLYPLGRNAWAMAQNCYGTCKNNIVPVSHRATKTKSHNNMI